MIGAQMAVGQGVDVDIVERSPSSLARSSADGKPQDRGFVRADYRNQPAADGGDPLRSTGVRPRGEANLGLRFICRCRQLDQGIATFRMIENAVHDIMCIFGPRAPVGESRGLVVAGRGGMVGHAVMFDSHVEGVEGTLADLPGGLGDRSKAARIPPRGRAG